MIFIFCSWLMSDVEIRRFCRESRYLRVLRGMNVFKVSFQAYLRLVNYRWSCQGFVKPWILCTLWWKLTWTLIFVGASLGKEFKSSNLSQLLEVWMRKSCFVFFISQLTNYRAGNNKNHWLTPSYKGSWVRCSLLLSTEGCGSIHVSI